MHVAQQAFRELALQRNERVVAHVCPGDSFLLLQRVLLGEDQHEGHFEQRLRGDFRRRIAFGADAEIDFAAEHARRDILHGAVDEAQLHVRVGLAVGGDHFRQQGARHHLRRGDAHHARFQGLALGNAGHGAVEVLDHLFKQRIQFAADFRQLRLARAALDHAHAQHAFQFLDQAAQGRLRYVQVFGGQGKTAGLGQRHEGAHLPQAGTHKIIR
ncbi:hypothetical protein D3C72_1071120 [compost metagenome]